MFQPDELLLALTRAKVRFVIIGGIAVGVHGYVRATKDLDIVPDPERSNLARLANELVALDAEHLGIGDFDPKEFPLDPRDPSQLAEGTNFRLTTSLGPLDIMQWVTGIETDPAYSELARDAIGVDFRGVQLLICSLDHLRAMKQAAAREQDLLDLRQLDAYRG